MFVNDAEICNYADDTTIYACDNNIEGIIETLESDALKIAEFIFHSFHLELFIHEKNPSAINIKNLLTNLNLEIKFLKSLKSYIPNLLLFQGVVF